MTTHTNQYFIQPQQLPDIAGAVVEIEEMMSNESDKIVLMHAVLILHMYLIDSALGLEACQAMAASPRIMNRLHFILTNELFKDDDLMVWATGILTELSRYEEGRAALLGCNYPTSENVDLQKPSLGVESLIYSLQSRDINVIGFAIRAIHNLLRDSMVALQGIAKAQIKYGLEYIVRLLDRPYECLKDDQKKVLFKGIVLECLQTLAYRNKENRQAIKMCGGPSLLLRTIRENFHDEELVKKASCVLKSLSSCPDSRIDIIENEGIELLTDCMSKDNQEILKNCLWTLRNLSDIINIRGLCKDALIRRLLQILSEYVEESSITTCALGTLRNLTCNNEPIKQFICAHDGVLLLLNTIAISFRDFEMMDKEILEPAVDTLCILMNQPQNPSLAEEVKISVRNSLDMFRSLARISGDFSRDVERLYNLAHTPNYTGLEGLEYV